MIFEDLGEKLDIARVLNNTGECSRLQGHYDRAMAYYEQALHLHEELGNKLSSAIVLGNVGHVYKAQGNNDKAMIAYNRSIVILRELGNKHFLSEYSIGKAGVLFLLHRYKEAQALNLEGLQIAEEIGRKDYSLQGNVLSAKVDFALGDKDAPRRLGEMLQQAEDKVEIATLHYELWKMTQEDEHRQTAFNFYQTLYAITPNIEYKTRMEELQ